jgi:hypothetical protein
VDAERREQPDESGDRSLRTSRAQVVAVQVEEG